MSPGLTDAGYGVRPCPPSARRQNASKNGRIALIRFDSLASTSPGLTDAGYSICPRPPSARRQNTSKNGRIALIRFDSLGFTLGGRFHSVFMQCRFAIRSAQTEGRLLIFIENGLIYFDWVGFAPSERSRSRILMQRRFATRCAQIEARLPVSIENALIYFDSLGFTVAAGLPPSFRSPLSGFRSRWIYFDSLRFTPTHPLAQDAFHTPFRPPFSGLRSR
jgi:hypothetical protein